MRKKSFPYIYLVIAFLLFPAVLFGQDKKTFTVVIDPGHGGKDAGTRGAYAQEKDINLSVSLKVGKLISDSHKDVKVIYTRKTDVFIELDERANIANRNKADLFMSIHSNSVRNRTPYGAETFTLGLARTEENLEVAKRENSVILLEDNYLQKYEGFDPNSSESYIIFEMMQSAHLDQSISLASEIQKEFSGAKRLDRGVKQAGFLVLRKTSMPSVLIELGFLSNRTEERYLRSANGQNALSKAIYDAFTRYKRDYDKKQGIAVKDTPAPPAVPVAETKTGNPPAKGQTIYKVQLFTSSTQLPANSKKLKGYQTDHYVENGVYKYTIGETSDLEEIKNVQKMVEKDFRDAFIISFKDGKRIK